MPLFYVPTVLVINADDENAADVAVENILDGVNYLGIRHFEGYFLMTGAENSPASPDWASKNQVIVHDIHPGPVRIAEE